MLNKLTEFIPNKMFNTIKLFFIKYWLRIKRKLNLSAVNIRRFALPYLTTNRICKHDNAENLLENLPYPSTEQAVNKTTYIHIEKIYI